VLGVADHEVTIFLSFIVYLHSSAMKYSLLLALLLSVCCSFAQNPPSPEEFLGYPLGAHFTPHHKIVGYFQAVAKSVPGIMKLEQYGATYEGRPLMLAFIASAENLRRLEEIRQNNLRLAGMLPATGTASATGTPHDGSADEHTPVIVWLSYNVHGNEPASSEAAMKMLYELVDPASARAKEWLKNTVVILDPCINPDGRDRYVNWYNDIVGAQPNPDAQSREHQEPWPRGRSNHYNFDLNRDWAWQTQIETQQRLKKYNSWLPQVHVDYHEQGYNNPYYFAPAAEPYHDVITPWQREFQIKIGKNNARYFDHNGWLYFTKEEFDLFYPSYGDTYPIYNGGIGMTFEQGGIGAGLAVQTADGDTLTLAQRLEHHFTTGVSTIEISSANADRLIKEFHAYFTAAIEHPGGEYKAYYLRNDSFGDRLERLKGFLDRNGIKYLSAGNGMFSGIDYETGRPANFKGAAGDIVINSNQPKSNLLRVLFERKSHITDSITYDITAWSVPYVYGVQAYGLNNYVTTVNMTMDDGSSDMVVHGPAPADTTYAYAVRWTGMGSVRFLTRLLKQGIRVRYAERPFESSGISFDKGTLIITSTGNGSVGDRLWPILKEAAHQAGVHPLPIATGFVDKGADFGSTLVHLIHRPRVAIMTGEEVSSLNAGEVWHLFEQEIGYPVTLVNAESAAKIAWKNFDVVILPNGNYQTLAEKNVADPLRNWVKEGGRLIAMQNAVEQLAKMEWGIRLKGDDGDKKEDGKDKKTDEEGSLRRYGNRQREEAANSVPGSIYRVEMDSTHPLAFGYPDHYYTLKEDDNVYEFLKDGGWNVGTIRKNGYVSGFTGVKAKEKIKDGLVFGVQDMGRGAIVYMADDPLFRSFWENGKLLFCNAVFLVRQ
jgi:hypothetical protein